MEIGEDRIPMRLDERGLSIVDLSSLLEVKNEALYLLEAQGGDQRERRPDHRKDLTKDPKSTPQKSHQQYDNQPEQTLTPLFQQPRVDQPPTTSPTPKFHSVDSKHAHDHRQHGQGAEGDGPREPRGEEDVALAPEQVVMTDCLNAVVNAERRSLEEESTRARPCRKSTASQGPMSETSMGDWCSPSSQQSSSRKRDDMTYEGPTKMRVDTTAEDETEIMTRRAVLMRELAKLEQIEKERRRRTNPGQPK